jgi:tRNA uridine 5-carboxymethylaminomethyl modification enzyme
MDCDFEIIVVGGGHAGCEAALASARSGVKTLLISLSASDLAFLPCNPSVGGLAKSHLVFELDALGGEIARNTDYAGLQFRVLNTRRGAAVHANRVQCDKHVYSYRMTKVVHQTANLTVLEDEVVGLVLKGDIVAGVKTLKRGDISSKRVIITAGTFLRGTIHIGDEVTPGGGGGFPASNLLAEQLEKMGLSKERLKTGTPPRLKPSSVDYSAMTRQDGEDPAPLFSWEAGKAAAKGEMFHVEHFADTFSIKSTTDELNSVYSDNFLPQEKESSVNKSPYRGHPGVKNTPKMFHVEHFKPVWLPDSEQVPCFLSQTTPKTHEIVRSNLKRSALYGGGIIGTGVRYCPSLEDKVVKFSEKEHHHVFIEPESGCSELNLEYPNGLSCSLPRDVQFDMVHSVPGLEKAEIIDFGYAIEYDFYDPRDLFPSLESKFIHGLYLAGQVNGTTGYEEAAALGFMAGVNAARSLNDDPPIILSRTDAYIGVMIDDLVTKGTNEPYRMFTSRAERRLILRQHNSRYRLMTFSNQLGLVNRDFLDETKKYKKIIDSEVERLNQERLTGVPLASHLCRVGMNYSMLPGALDLPQEVVNEIEIEVRYKGYIEHENKLAENIKRSESTIIPDGIDYMSIQTIRYEAREKLAKIRPQNLGAAGRIPGVTPADVAMLSVAVRSIARKKF